MYSRTAVGVGIEHVGPTDINLSRDRATLMIIILVVALVGAVIGTCGYLAAKRWPEPVEAPHVSGQTIAAGVEARPGLARRLRRTRTDPNELTGLALTVALGVIVGAAVGLGLLLAMIHGHSGLARWDLTFAEFGARHATHTSTLLLRDLSQIGGTVGVITIGVVVAAVEYRRIRSLAVVAFLFLVIGGQFAASNLIKLMVGRPRPAILHLTGFSGTSFPSGHSTAAAATLMACAFLLGRRRTSTTKAVLVGTAVGLAAAVASTRVLLGVHWFTDVLAGLLLGWAWFALCSIAFGGRLLRFGAPGRQAETVAEAQAPV
jgi:membrane-associated phospholipid phosphatase